MSESRKAVGIDIAAPVREAIAAATLVPSASLTVAKAGLGNDAGLVGAARMAMRD